MSVIYINSYQFASAAQLWTPANITTTIWLDASDASTVTLSGSSVAAWNDKSGNAHNFTETNDQPTYQLASQNGLNAINFVNTGSARQFLGNTSFQYEGDKISLFSVHKNLSTAGTAYQYGRLFSFAPTFAEDYNSEAGILLVYGITSGITLFRSNATIATTGAISDTWCVVDAERNQGTGRIALNGDTYATGTTSTANNNIQRSRIGNDFIAVDSGLNGLVGEQIAIVGDVLESDRQKIQGYLAHKWGLAGDLPATHPYKSAAPTV